MQEPTPCGVSALPLELRTHPHVLTIIAAAYAHGTPKQPIRGFGHEMYGEHVVLAGVRWRAIAQMRDVGRGREHGVLITRWDKAYTEGSPRTSWWLPVRSLVESVLKVEEAYEVGE